jgi:hypothetical protein
MHTHTLKLKYWESVSVGNYYYAHDGDFPQKNMVLLCTDVLQSLFPKTFRSNPSAIELTASRTAFKGSSCATLHEPGALAQWKIKHRVVTLSFFTTRTIASLFPNAKRLYVRFESLDKCASRAAK